MPTILNADQQGQPSNQSSGGGQVGGDSSSGDPRGRLQNQSAYQQNRYESQQGPLANVMAMNYGRGSEADYGNYTDIMNNYRDIASGQGAGAPYATVGYASGAYNGPGYSAFQVTPGTTQAGTASYTDPFGSYSKYQGLADTGGYSAQDMADLRARGTAPVRAAYANAQDNINRQRSLQGGYSPNAIAAQSQMARQQSQGMSDAMQNVNAGIIGARNQGQLAGMQGMTGIEGQRLGADVDLSKFNVGTQLQNSQYNNSLNYQGQTYNADAQARAQAGNIGIGQSNAAANASAQNQGAAATNAASAAAAARQFGALGGMTTLYGTTPGMSNTFGNQAINIVGQGGNFGNNLYGNDIRAQQAPGQFDQTMSRAEQIAKAASGGSNAFQNSGGFNPTTNGYQGGNPYGNNLPSTDTTGGYQYANPPDFSQGDTGPGMMNYYNNGGGYDPYGGGSPDPFFGY